MSLLLSFCPLLCHSHLLLQNSTLFCFMTESEAYSLLSKAWFGLYSKQWQSAALILIDFNTSVRASPIVWPGPAKCQTSIAVRRSLCFALGQARTSGCLPSFVGPGSGFDSKCFCWSAGVTWPTWPSDPHFVSAELGHWSQWGRCRYCCRQLSWSGSPGVFSCSGSTEARTIWTTTWLSKSEAAAPERMRVLLLGRSAKLSYWI